MSPTEATCAVHFEEAANARCRSCGRSMCLECWKHDVDGIAWCEPCVRLLEQPTPVVLNVAASTLVIGLTFVIARKLLGEPGQWFATGGVAVVTLIAALKLHGRAERSRLAHRIVERPAAPAAANLQSPYRGRLRRLARSVAPPVSGTMAALVASMLLGLIAGVVPTTLELPRWIEWQIVMAGWWLVWAGAFSTLLYRGWRIARDMPDLRRGKSDDSKWSFGRLDFTDGCTDPEGCMMAFAGLFIFLVALVLTWVLVELIVPVLFAAAYWFIMRALTRVANDRHDCEGKLVKSLSWGGAWALLYTAPLALLIWIGHLMLAR